MRSRAALLVTLLLYGSPVLAGSFEVAPTTVILPSSAGATTIHVSNRGQDPVFAQVEALDWTQDGMKEQLTKTTTLQVSPPMMRLAPGQQQIVRLLVKDDSKNSKERAFRMVVSELPDPTVKKEGIQVLLQFLVPVFVQPSSRSIPALAWKAKLEPDGITLTAMNNGAQHLKLSNMIITTKSGKQLAVSGKAFNYLLTGASHQWKFPSADIIAGETLKIQARDETAGILEGSYVIER